MAPITVIPFPLFLLIGYFTGSIFGVQVRLLRSHRLKEASSKYTSGYPEAITFDSLTPKFFHGEGRPREGLLIDVAHG